MIFFTDANISTQTARLLEAFDRDNEIRPYAHRFGEGVADASWLKEIAADKPKPIVLGGDGRILENRVEQQVLRECNLMFVLLAKGWTNLSWDDFAWKIIKAWPDIVRNVSKAREPSVFKVAVSSLKVDLYRATARL